MTPRCVIRLITVDVKNHILESLNYVHILQVHLAAMTPVTYKRDIFWPLEDSAAISNFQTHMKDRYKHTITWVNVDSDLYCRMTSPDHKELIWNSNISSNWGGAHLVYWSWGLLGLMEPKNNTGASMSLNPKVLPISTINKPQWVKVLQDFMRLMGILNNAMIYKALFGIRYSHFTLNGRILYCIYIYSPWAKTQIFTYRYHLGGQNLVIFFIYTYAQCIIQAMINLWIRQLSCGYHQFRLFYFSKITYFYLSVIFN